MRRASRLPLYATASLQLMLAASCSVIVDADRRQCQSDWECVSQGGVFAQSQCVQGYCERLGVDSMASTAWECVSQDGSITSEDPLDLTVPVSSLLEEGPLSGVLVRTCRKVDPECDGPIQEAVSDAEGLLHLSLPPGFSGYLEVEQSGYYPMLYFLPADMQTGAQLPPLTMLPPAVTMALGSALGTSLDPSRGHILLTSLDCQGETAAGLRYEASSAEPGATPFYVDASLPAPNLTQTTTAGSGGFVNFPVGATSLAILDGATETELATVSVLVRAGYISMAHFGPAPPQGGTVDTD